MGVSDFPAVEAKVTENGSEGRKRIEVNLHERKQQDEFIPLCLLFEYNPSQGYAPIHEVMEGRNKRIKEFYWHLWFGKEPFALSQGDGYMSLPENFGTFSSFLFYFSLLG